MLTRRIPKLRAGNEINQWRPSWNRRKMFGSPHRPRQLPVMENALWRARHPLAEWSAMQRRRFEQVLSFPDRLAEEIAHLRAEAEKLPPGEERHELERKARQAETAAHIDEWLKSLGLRAPE